MVSYTVGIIGALDDEVAYYLDEMKPVKEIQKGPFRFCVGKVCGKNVVLVKSGIGKVNAALCTQALIDNFKVDLVIFTGVAGALNPSLNLFDIVISKDSIQHDMDAEGLGFEKGRIPFYKKTEFTASDTLAKCALEASKKANLPAIIGRMLSGDQFVSDALKSKKMRTDFNGDCVDMESAAVAHACTINNIPHIIIRSISDKADHSAKVDFWEFCKKAAKNSFTLVKMMLSDPRLDEFETKISILEKIQSTIRTVPDWPKKGIMFRDITTLIRDPIAFSQTIDTLVQKYRGEKIDYIVGIEARGFIIGAALAHQLGIGFIPIRKKGKLPSKTISQEYMLEYGTDKIEIHADALQPDDQVLLVDDLIATGGTAVAACELIKKCGATIVECVFIVNLPDLGGAQKLEKNGYSVSYLVEFKGE